MIKINPVAYRYITMMSLIIRLVIIVFLFAILSCADQENSRKASPGWTLMVYANADNNLEKFILDDLKEMELGYRDGGEITVIVLCDRVNNYSSTYGDWKDTRLFKISHNDDTETFISEELNSETLGLSVASTKEELDMGDWHTLAAFVDFCQQQYPAEHYALVMEGHGDGWYAREVDTSEVASKEPFLASTQSVAKSVSSDATSYSEIGSNELPLALAEKNIDIICFDACAMGTIEVAYELQQCAYYLVASPRTLPDTGFYYRDLLEKLYENTGSVEAFASAFVTSYADAYPFSDKSMMSIDIKAIATLVDQEMDRFIAFLNDSCNEVELEEVRAEVSGYYAHDREVYLDIIDFAHQTGATAFATRLESALVAAVSGKKMLSVFFPRALCYYDAYYENTLAFCRTTGWNEYVLSHLQAINNQRDLYEPDNNLFSTAVSVHKADYTSYIAAAYDSDIYRIDVAGKGSLIVSLHDLPPEKNYSFTFHKAPLAFFTLDSSGDTQGNGEDEYLEYDITEPGTYYVKIFGKRSSDTSYEKSYCVSFSGTADY